MITWRSNAGRIEQVGTGPELYANPQTHFVADFIGDSTFLTGEIEAVQNGQASMIFGDGSRVAGVPLHGDLQSGKKAELMLRPERIDLSAEAGAQGASLPVRVQDMTFLGSNTTVEVCTAWGDPLTVRLGFGHPLMGHVTKGDRLHIHWAADSAQAFIRS